MRKSLGKRNDSNVWPESHGRVPPLGTQVWMRKMMTFWVRGGAAALLIATVPALADAPRAPLFEAVIKCRSIPDAVARAACYDRAVDALDSAERERKITVIDAGQVREVRKRLFGLTLPNLPVFGERTVDTPEIKQLDGTLAAASEDRYGHWLLTLADGSVWRQMDDLPVARAPREGDPVTVRRGTLGSFRISVHGEPSLRVRREASGG